MSCFSFCKGKSKCETTCSAPQLGQTSKVGRSTSASAAAAAKSVVVNSSESSRTLSEIFQEKEHRLRVFSYSELKKATDGFMLTLGGGGFGRVYKGLIRPADGVGDPFFVAIKKLNRNGLQGHKEWLAEVHFLGIVDHPNLVKLIGYSNSYAEEEQGIELLLVYEYMPNKSLEDHLFNKALPPLPWKSRLQILLDAAQGLAYLHEGMEIRVIYRDFKSSNVLLDNNFEAKLSDFGLAREGPQGDNTHVSTGVFGTLGYAAPEYVTTGHLTAKCDLYSFGVVLYETLTGRRTVEINLPVSKQNLVEWVKLYSPDGKKFSKIIDPRLRNQYSLTAARKVAKLADRCVQKNAKQRPTMKEVIERLKEAITD